MSGIRKTQAWCEDNLAPVLDGLDQNLVTCFGEDFGRSGDLTVIWLLQIAADLVRRTPMVVELRNIPFRNQEQVLFYIADSNSALRRGAMDARGNGQYLAETAAQRYGSRNRSGDALRGVVPGKYAALQGGVRRRNHRNSKRCGRVVGPSRVRARARSREDQRAALGQRRQGTDMATPRWRRRSHTSRHRADDGQFGYLAAPSARTRQSLSESGIQNNPFGAPPEEDALAVGRQVRGF